MLVCILPTSLAFGDEVFDPPTISNPNLFTSRSSLPDVDQSTGAFTQRFPLDIPPGRNGLTPDLALQYNSQQLDDGIVGYGWSLSLPYIERFNRTGVERLYTDNYFSSSFGGELATTSTSEYQHRFEDGRFIKYTFSNNSWIAYDKKGTKYTFGASTTAQLYATTTPSNVYRWMLEEIRDTNDNYITYFYTRDTSTNQIYPTRITYTGNGSTDGIFTIDFARATRTDPITSYRSGFLVRTTDRITEIKASVSGSWVRKYALSYTAGQNGARSLLESVQLTGRDDEGTELTLPATAFAYSTTTPGYVEHTNLKTWNATRAIADSDGNGLPDLNIFYDYPPTGGTWRWIDENEYPTFTNHNAVGGSEYWAHNGAGGPGGYAYLESGTRLVDMTGDGKADVLRGQKVHQVGGSDTYTFSFYENQGSFNWAAKTISTTTFPTFEYTYVGTNGSDILTTGLFGNINGDGLVDYVQSLSHSFAPPNGTFLHAGTSTAMWTEATSTFGAIAEMPTSGTSQVANELVDINGDGLDDWMNAGSGSITFCLNTGTSWGSCSSPWNIATSSRGINGWDRGIRFIDINGDGLLDYVRSYSIDYQNKYSGTLDIEKGSYNYVYLNTGSGFATSTLQVPATIVSADNIPSGSWGGRIVYNELVDWNGDGILDTNGLTSTTTKPELLNRITLPTGGTKEVGYTFSSQQASVNPNLAFPMLLVASTTNSDGFGTRETTLYTYEGGKMYLAGDVRDRRFAGFEKITKQDALGSTQTYYHQGDTASTTAGELTDSFVLVGKPYREDVLSTSSNTLKKTFYRWDSVNIGSVATTTAGNSHSLDLEKNSSQYASISDASQSGLDLSNNLTAALWVKFESLPSGGNVDPFVMKRVATGNQRSYSFYSYNSLSLDTQYDGFNASCSVSVSWSPSTATWYQVAVTKSGTSVKFYVNGSQQGSTQTCSSSDIYNGTAPVEIGGWPTGATYHDGLVDDARVWSRELSGSEISDLYSTPGTVSNGANLQGFWKFNSAYTDSSGNGNTLTANGSPVFTTTVPFTYTEGASTTPYGWFSYVASETVQDWGGGASHRDRATEYTYSTTTGNLTQQVERGEVSGNSDGTYADTGSDARFTTFTYSTTTAINMSLPSSKIVKDNASSTVQLTNFYYDNASFGSTTKGNLTKEENWIGGLTYGSSTKGYNTYGLIASSTDPRGATTTYAYESNNLYVATSTNALGHVTGGLYDYAKGAAKRTIDAHGLVRTFTFDPVGRVTEEKQPDLTTPSTLVTSKTYTYTDTFPNSVQTTVYFTSATSSGVYRYVDGLGRTIQERAQGGGSNTYAVKDYIYGTHGLLAQESLPYFASSTARSSATSTAALFTTTLYDALKRATSTANAVGTTSLAYAPWRTKVTDPNGNPKDLHRDAYGNLASVVEHDELLSATTTYSYDALQNLTSITDALANVRSFTYDGLSRRLTAQDLHDAGDGTFGTWSYAYDLASNIASTSDPLSQVVSFSYDVLNRVTAEDYTGGSGTEVTYAYDSCTYGKGKLCSASSTNAYTSTAYNALGLASGEAKRINSTSYATTSSSYDRQGNVTDLVYPDGREVHYGYDTGGRIADIATKPNGGSYSTVLSGIQYAPHGQVSSRPYGNGVEIPFVYNANQLYRLTRIGDTSGGVQSLSYTYDSVGNILTLADASASTTNHSVAFTYDDLNRLTEASTTAATSTPFREMYRYNALGNLLYKGTNTATTTSNTRSLDLESSSSQYASISDASQTGLDFSDAMTLTTWVKFETLTTGGNADPFVMKRVATGNQRSYSFYANPSAGFLDLDTQYDGFNASCSVSVSWAPSTATWYHVAVTKSGTSVKFYVNGSQQGSTQTCTSSTIYNGTAPVEIGGWVAGATYHDGLVDDARVWSRELSGSEISDLYSAPGVFDNGANLQGWWKLENAYTDASGNANTLTGQGSPVFSTDVPYTTGGGSSEAPDNYTYAETNYANPHAPSSFFNGSATTTYAYDANGNLTGTTGAATSSFMWDYRNRMIEAWAAGATSTYQYDHTIARMAQITPTTTTHYPSKFYSVEYQGSSTTTGTSTSYIFHGDTLIAYIEQRIASGQATGTPTTYYVHPDHLGSTNVVTDEEGDVVEAIDYYPYGAERIHSGSADADRTFIGQFGDDPTSLSYLNARYYDGTRGQFVGQDPVFLAIGNPAQLQRLAQQEQQRFLMDPQQMNSYSYARGNPIVNKDPTGNNPLVIAGAAGAVFAVGQQAYMDAYNGQFSGFKVYGTQAVIGGATGVGVALAAVSAPVTATGIGFLGAYSSSVYGDAYNPANIAGEIDQTKAVAQGIMSVATMGFGRMIPGIPGPYPKLSTLVNNFPQNPITASTNFFFSRHAQRDVLQQLSSTLGALLVELNRLQDNQKSGTKDTTSPSQSQKKRANRRRRKAIGETAYDPNRKWIWQTFAFMLILPAFALMLTPRTDPMFYALLFIVVVVIVIFSTLLRLGSLHLKGGVLSQEDLFRNQSLKVGDIQQIEVVRHGFWGGTYITTKDTKINVNHSLFDEETRNDLTEDLKELNATIHMKGR